jgi:hypothetical protein
MSCNCSGEAASRLDDFGFGTQLGDQGGHIWHLDAGRALGWFGNFQGFQAWRNINAQVFRLGDVERFFLGRLPGNERLSHPGRSRWHRHADAVWN